METALCSDATKQVHNVKHDQLGTATVSLDLVYSHHADWCGRTKIHEPRGAWKYGVLLCRLRTAIIATASDREHCQLHLSRSELMCHKVAFMHEALQSAIARQRKKATSLWLSLQITAVTTLDRTMYPAMAQHVCLPRAARSFGRGHSVRQ